MSTIVPLFPTLLLKLQIDPPKDLIDFVHTYYKQKKYTPKQRSNRLGWQSSTLDIPQLQPVHQHIHDNTTIDLALGPAWINVNHTGAYNVTHIHPNCDYTFVYYLTDNNAELVLDCPNMYAYHNHQHIQTQQTKQQYNLGLEHRIQPTKGMLLMFPSYVPHRVEVNTNTESRMSLSWGGDCINNIHTKRIHPRQ